MFCVRPLRFLKQCITCLFSVNPEEFGTRHPYLRQFVLNRDLRGLPPQYDVYLTLVSGSRSRRVGVSASLSLEKLSLEKRSIRVMTEFAQMPFAITMTLDSPFENDVGRISHWANYAYDEEVDLCQPVWQGHIVTPFPSDFRSQGQLDRDVTRNRLEALGLQPA